jgi:hypothetical protein
MAYVNGGLASAMKHHPLFRQRVEPLQLSPPPLSRNDDNGTYAKVSYSSTVPVNMEDCGSPPLSMLIDAGKEPPQQHQPSVQKSHSFRQSDKLPYSVCEDTPSLPSNVGLTPFIKPRALRQYPELGLEACTKALLDANITYDDINAGVACYCYGDTTSGQRIFYQLGMTGIPIYNTNNACATGSTGLHLARQMVRGGLADAVLVCGFEQMQAGSIKSVWGDRPSPMGLSTDLMEETYGRHGSPRNAQYFANAGREYMEK